MTLHSQHPEFEVTDALREAVERVRSGIEPVIVLTDVGGEPLAAVVPLSALQLLDEREIATRSESELEDSDCTGMHVR